MRTLLWLGSLCLGICMIYSVQAPTACKQAPRLSWDGVSGCLTPQTELFPASAVLYLVSPSFCPAAVLSLFAPESALTPWCSQGSRHLFLFPSPAGRVGACVPTHSGLGCELEPSDCSAVRSVPCVGSGYRKRAEARLVAMARCASN